MQYNWARSWFKAYNQLFKDTFATRKVHESFENIKLDLQYVILPLFSAYILLRPDVTKFEFCDSDTHQLGTILVLDFRRPSISGSIRSIKMYSWA